jgi:hypothetical protein
MTKATPGPWAIGRKLSAQWIITGYGKDIASVKVNRFADNSTNEANAHLIAAAPGLLAALKSALDHIETLCPDSHDVLKTKISATIAKATGGAS